MLWLFLELFTLATANLQSASVSSSHQHSIQIQPFTYTHSFTPSSLNHSILLEHILLLSNGTYVQVRTANDRTRSGRTNRIFYSLCLTYVKKKSKRAKKSSILFLNATNLVFSPFPRTSIHFLMLCYPKSPAEWQMFSKIKHLSYLIFILSSAKWIDLFQMSRIHRRGRFEKLSS